MTDKPVITREQAKAIEDWADKEQLIVAKATGLLEHGRDEPIDELTMKELVVALYIGYEVEPEWKYGDWFVYIGEDGEVAEHVKNGFMEQVERVDYDYITDGYHWFYNKEIRPATPSEIAEEKERRWWIKLGREVKEYRRGDVVKGKGVYSDKWRLGLIKKTFQNYDDTFIQIEDISDGSAYDLKIDSCIMICPVENRLDREGGE